MKQTVKRITAEKAKAAVNAQESMELDDKELEQVSGGAVASDADGSVCCVCGSTDTYGISMGKLMGKACIEVKCRVCQGNSIVYTK